MDQPPTKFICIFVWLIRLNVLVLVSVWIMGLAASGRIKANSICSNCQSFVCQRTLAKWFRSLLSSDPTGVCWSVLDDQNQPLCYKKVSAAITEKEKNCFMPFFFCGPKKTCLIVECVQKHTHTRMYIWKPSTLLVRGHMLRIEEQSSSSSSL